MPKFKVTFCDVFEADDEIAAYDKLLVYLKECVEMEEACAFGFEEINDDGS